MPRRRSTKRSPSSRGRSTPPRGRGGRFVSRARAATTTKRRRRRSSAPVATTTARKTRTRYKTRTVFVTRKRRRGGARTGSRAARIVGTVLAIGVPLAGAAILVPRVQPQLSELAPTERLTGIGAAGWLGGATVLTGLLLPSRWVVARDILIGTGAGFLLGEAVVQVDKRLGNGGLIPLPGGPIPQQLPAIPGAGQGGAGAGDAGAQRTAQGARRAASSEQDAMAAGLAAFQSVLLAGGSSADAKARGTATYTARGGRDLAGYTESQDAFAAQVVTSGLRREVVQEVGRILDERGLSPRDYLLGLRRAA